MQPSRPDSARHVLTLAVASARSDGCTHCLARNAWVERLMALRSKWTVRVEALRTTLRVGIYEHELHHQPILLKLRISGLAEALPHTLAQCFDYEPICRWALEEWPLSPHTPLLETRLNKWPIQV